MNDISKIIGKRLRLCRTEKKMRQEEIAEKCGCVRQTVASWEAGTATPTIQQLYTLCDLFQCEIGYLLGEQEAKRRIVDDIQKTLPLSSEAIENLISADAIKIKAIDIFLTEQSFKEILYDIYIISSKYRAHESIRKKTNRAKALQENKKLTPPYDLICERICKEIRIDEYTLNNRFYELSRAAFKRMESSHIVKEFSENYKEQQYLSFEKENPSVGRIER